MEKIKLNIQLFATGSFDVATKNSNISGYVALSSTSNGSSANSSQVKAILYLRRTNNYTGTPSYTYNFVPTFTIDGQSHSYTISTKISIPNDKSYVKMAEWETTVAHNDDGTKYCEVSIKTTSEGGNSFTVPLTSGGFQLDTIPRYANITTFYLTTLSRTEIQITWDADVSCDAVEYSLNGGGWTRASGYPSFVIGGLSAGTQYSVRIRVKRTDSQLWTESGTLYATTIYNAYIISANDFNDEQNPYMTYSSPSGTNVTLRLEFSGGIINRQNISPGSNYTFQLTDAERNLLREKATSNTLGVRFVVATLENGNEVVWSWLDKTMTIINANPSFNNFVFEDIKTNTVALTGNNKNFINKNSKVKVTIPVANKMVALKGSWAKRYDITVGNVTKQVNYSDTLDVSAEFDNVETSTMFVTAIDSRGNKTALTKNANYLYAYNQPSFSVIKGIRQNGVGTVVELSVSGNYSNTNFGNASNTILNILYSKDNQQTWEDITDKFVFSNGTFSSVAGTILTNFELGQEYYLYFKIIDGGVVNETNYTLKEVISERLTINSGQPILDINKTKKGVGVNCIAEEEGLWVNGVKITSPKAIKLSNTSNSTTVNNYVQFPQVDYISSNEYFESDTTSGRGGIRFKKSGLYLVYGSVSIGNGADVYQLLIYSNGTWLNREQKQHRSITGEAGFTIPSTVIKGYEGQDVAIALTGTTSFNVSPYSTWLEAIWLGDDINV